jgi:hypothetical protein
MGMAGTLRGSMTPRAAVVLWWCGRGASWGLPGRTRHFVTGQVARCRYQVDDLVC